MDSLFGTGPDDEQIMDQLRQILVQQQQLINELNASWPNSQQSAQESSANDLTSIKHANISGEDSGDADEAVEHRQPRMHAAVLQTEEKHIITTTIQPVVNKNLVHHTLPPPELIDSKMTEGSFTILPVIGPQQPPFITTTHSPDNTSAPVETQQLVNIKVGTFSGSRFTDDILVGDQARVHHAVRRPGRRIKTDINKQSRCVSFAKRAKRSISELFHQINKDVHPGRTVNRIVQSGPWSNGLAEYFAHTGQQTLKTTTTGEKALRTTSSDHILHCRAIIQSTSPIKTRSTPLLFELSPLLKQKHRFNQQHNPRVKSCVVVHQFAVWPWDPGQLKDQVERTWWPLNEHISTDLFGQVNIISRLMLRIRSVEDDVTATIGIRTTICKVVCESIVHLPVSCKTTTSETSQDRTAQIIVENKSWLPISTKTSQPGTFWSCNTGGSKVRVDKSCSLGGSRNYILGYDCTRGKLIQMKCSSR